MNPERVFETLMGFRSAAVLRTAIELDVFSHVQQGRRTPAALAGPTGASERGLRILLDALVAPELLTKTDGEYRLTPISEQFLVRGTPTYMGDASNIMTHPVLWTAMGNLTDAVRAGGSTLERGAETPGHEFWANFAKFSESFSAPAAEQIVERLKLSHEPIDVLDVAAGSGTYGFTVAQRRPKARVTALDWPNVLDAAKPRAKALGLDGRIRWLPGDAFTADLGGPYDVILVSHLFHHFSLDKVAALSRRFADALKDGGVLAVHEFVPDETRAKESASLLFAVIMLVWSKEGDCYTLDQYRNVFRDAGLRGTELYPLPPLFSHLIVAMKP